MDGRKLPSMHVVFKRYLRPGCETAVLLVEGWGAVSRANFPYLIDFSF